MQNYITALKAEHLKKKGTGIYVVAIILGAISPILLGIIRLFDDPQAGEGGIPYNYYLRFIEETLDPFAGFFFPMLIIITVSRLTQLDHKYGGWQLMETQPIQKLSIYFSKFTVALISNLISITSLVVVAYLTAFLLSFAFDIPKHATTEFAFSDIFWLMARLFFASLLFTAFQYVLSVLMPSFIWSMLIGIFLLLTFLFLKGFSVTVPAWYPMETLDKVYKYKKGSDLGYWLTYSEAVSFLTGIILLYVGFKWYKHKGIKNAFFSNGGRFAKLAAVLVIIGGLLAYTLMPNHMAPYDKTVVSGTVEGTTTVQNVYVRDMFIKDTIAVIPVKDGKFHAVIDKDLALDKYEVLYDEAAQDFIILKNKDSINIELKLYGQQLSSVKKGTRLAENNYSAKEDNSWSSISYYLDQNMFMENPTFIIDQLVDEWNEKMDESNEFKTVDNFVLREDFIEKEKKLITIKYLNLWDSFIKKRAALYPNEKTVETAEIKEMKKIVPLNDESLISNGEYFNYVMTQMTAGNKEDIDQNTKALLAINKLSAGSFKDKMLYWQLNKSIKEASDKEERTKLLDRYANTFNDKRYTSIIQNNSKIIESLGEGKVASQFLAMTLDKKEVSLGSLKGKYVLIDVWATWCGPCKYQSPFFEKFALKYKDQPIQFVALSTDQRIDSWFIEAKSKSKSVLQLHANDAKKLSKDYDIQGIPRFILIDPQGNFVNSNMPFPDDPLFEKLLREALKLPEQK
ncbi:redoxin family protein [Flavobacterium hauense]